VARTKKRHREDPPHLSGRRRQLQSNVSPTERWVVARSQRPTRSRVPEWTHGAERRASRPETTNRSREGLRRWKAERPTRKSEKRRTFTKGYAEGSRKRSARRGRRRAKVRASIRRVVSPKTEEARGNGGPRDTRAQSDPEGVPQGKRAPEVTEDSEARSTDAGAREVTYLTEGYGGERSGKWDVRCGRVRAE
jgi:hypothetical protein